MNGGRGAKGSINDRLISMMYRNRYKSFELKKEAYAKEAKIREREYLKKIQTFDIADGTLDLEEKEQNVISEALDEVTLIPQEHKKGTSVETLNTISVSAGNVSYGTNTTTSSLHDLSEKMIEVDPAKEVFDFENFDYYQIINSQAKVAGLPADEIVDVEKEITKVEDEITIVEELETFIDESKEEIEEIKKEISAFREDVKEQYTSEQMEEMQKRYEKIKTKVDKLKAKYDAISERYDFSEFHLLENLTMAVAIEEYNDLATLDEIETLVDYCKEEIEQIDGIVVEQQKTVYAAEEAEEQKQVIHRREEDFSKNQTGVIYLDDLEKKIALEAREQRELIAQIEKKLAEFHTDVREVTDVVYHTERLFGSFLRIAAGILTAPFSGRNVFGTFLGTELINRGIRDLRASLEPEYVKRTEIVHSYTSVEREILNSIDHVKDTARVIDDSIDQIKKFDEEFKEKFKEYRDLIPEYATLEKQIADLKKKLSLKKVEVKEMQNDLSRQYEVNKVKVKKAA
jgi:hypothetical protein